jgi:hypothetical protein
MPEAVWKAYIDFEIGQVSCGAVRVQLMCQPSLSACLV